MAGTARARNRELRYELIKMVRKAPQPRLDEYVAATDGLEGSSGPSIYSDSTIESYVSADGSATFSATRILTHSPQCRLI
jgi:hypothetical protein